MQAGNEDGGRRSGPSDPPSGGLETSEYSLLDFLGTLYRRRLLIAAITAVGIILGSAAALRAHRVYAAHVKVVPALFLSSPGDVSALAQLRSAASQFGMGIGGSTANPSPLLPYLLASGDFLARLLSREYPLRDGSSVALARYLGIERSDSDGTLQDGADVLRAALRSGYDMRSGVTTITATFRDPRLAAAVANDCAAELDLSLRGLKTSQAGKKAGFISQRLTEVKAQLEHDEDALKAFRERNRQTSGSPQLMLEEARLLREVNMNEQVFITLNAQLEIARIDEVRNTPDLVILEKAVPPPGHAGRLRTMATLTLLFGLIGVVAALSLEHLDGLKRVIRDRRR